MSKLESPVLNPVQKDNGEVKKPKPFVIRGHHLPHFVMLVNKYHYPNLKLSQMLAKHMRRDIEGLSVRAKYCSNDTTTRQEEEGYAQDVLGIGLKQADKFEKYLVLTFREFFRLTDNHPAEIVEGVPDIICEGCANGIGKHCYKSYTLSGDGAFLDAFLENSDALNLPKPTITQKSAYFSDAQPQQARRIKTTIGAIKKILMEGEFDLIGDI